MNNSRRSFIKNSSIVIAGTSILPGSVTFSSGKKEEKLAIQLYSVDKEMNEDVESTLIRLKKIGYNYVEHANYANRKFYGYSPETFRKMLNNCDLNLLSGHTVLELQHWNTSTMNFTREWHYAIEDAVKAGQQFIISPWLDRSLWGNETALKHFMDVFNKSGELCKKEGLKFGYHNHDFEFTHTLNFLRLYDVILQSTDPKLVFQQLDIGNIYQTNFSVADLISKYPGRFELMHVKDIIQSNQRHQQYKSAVIGKGILDMKNIISAARTQGGTLCFITEYDAFPLADPFKYAKENFSAFNNMNYIPGLLANKI